MGAERRARRRPDAAIAALAGSQHGVVARRQLLALGLGRRAIGHRLECGRLHAVHRGVYAVGHRALSGDAMWMAAVLACGPDAVLSHRSAATLWGMGVFASAVIDVTVSPARRTRRRIRVHRAVLRAQERAIVRVIPVTSATRTLLDLAAVVESRQLERAFDEADVLRLGDRLALAQAVARHRGRPGTVALRQLLAKGHGDAVITRSQLEDRFIALVDAHGLPRPQVNAGLELADRRIEADCVWRAARLVVELDGYSSHGTRAAFERDRARDRALLVAGWRIVRITWRQLSDAPAAVARELTTLLTAPPR